MQEPDDRRTVDELITLYEVAPDVQDIFTEGRSDRNFLSENLFGEDRPTLCNIYAVSDRVSISDGDLINAGIMVGERGRVIWLAQQLAKRIPHQTSAALIADKDFASLQADTQEEVHGLLYTDYSSMEAYALNERTTSKLLHIPIGAPEYVTPSMLLSAIKPALISLFLIRLTLRESGTGATIPPRLLGKWDLEDQSEEKVREVFRLALHTLPAKERNGETPESLYSRYVEYESKVDGDFRHYFSGHDASVMIVRFLKIECIQVFNREGRRALLDPAVMELVMMSCIEKSHLDDETMFQALRQWVQTRTW
ncbi:hypothetical protein AB0I66_37725 [Streptomyces sp. NPDC050439]|uniref:hypothetical protein n=1 Tax=unclassified Streptomyces TaxID=2593676 RepID=UPI0034263676